MRAVAAQQQAQGIDNNNRGVGGGIPDLGINNENGGISGGVLSQRFQHRQRRRRWRIDNASKVSEITTEAEEARRRYQWVDFRSYRVANGNTVSSVSCRCLVLIFFSSDFFF